MSADLTRSSARTNRRLRADLPDLDGEEGPAAPIRPLAMIGVFIASACGFVLLGGGSLELGPIEAKVGISALEPIGPFGQALGGWDPGVWVGEVLPCKVWASLGGMDDAGIVRWPTAVAAILIGLVLCRATRRAVGPTAASFAALAWFGSAALIDRSSDAGLDLIAGLGTVLALNRLLTKGSGWVAGLYAAWAFLAGGWPPLALIALASILLGRRGATLTLKTIVPVLATVVAWSAWALAATRSQVWAAALSLPLTEGSAWTMALGVVALGLPFSPLAALGLSRSVRDAWPSAGRPFVVGWGQVALASLVAGTLIPGLATAARLPAIAGLAIVAAASCEAALREPLSGIARRVLAATGLVVVLAWTGVMIGWGGYLAVAVGNYRTIAVVLIGLALVAAGLAIASSRLGNRRGLLIALLLVSASLKLADFGHHVPEWNYRHSQAPWGRAVGQWLPARTPLHVLVGWPADLVFAIGHPVRQLVDPRLLPGRPGPSPKFVLLTKSEFDNWQDEWPKIVLVARFEDEEGGGRVLARTEGPFSWRAASLAARNAE